MEMVLLDHCYPCESRLFRKQHILTRLDRRHYGLHTYLYARDIRTQSSRAQSCRLKKVLRNVGLEIETRSKHISSDASCSFHRSTNEALDLLPNRSTAKSIHSIHLRPNLSLVYYLPTG